jgi:hypothetical protein
VTTAALRYDTRMRTPGGRLWRVVCCLALLGGLASQLGGCASARVTPLAPVNAAAAAPVAPPPVIVVYDFELDAANVHSEPGLLPHPLARAPIVGGLLHGRSACKSGGDPGACAAEIQELIADSLVKDLRKAGLTAMRGTPGAELPQQGWLVRGVFTDVDTGNQLRRAVIGFGQGATQMQLMLAIDDLSRGVPQALYSAGGSASSGSAPGAVVLMNPAAMGVRFVMSRDDLDKSAKKLAQEVSDTIAARAGISSAR